MNYKNAKILYTKGQIQKRINELALKIYKDYKEKKLILIGILKGSFILTADLSKALFKTGFEDFEVDFLKISSYGSKTKSIGKPKISWGINKIKGKNILLIDDILDSGKTLYYAQQIILKKNPNSLKTLVLLSKPVKREADTKVDYIGFKLEKDSWVEGYGLDSNELGRGNSNIIEWINE